MWTWAGREEPGVVAEPGKASVSAEGAETEIETAESEPGPWSVRECGGEEPGVIVGLRPGKGWRRLEVVVREWVEGEGDEGEWAR